IPLFRGHIQRASATFWRSLQRPLKSPPRIVSRRTACRENRCKSRSSISQEALSRNPSRVSLPSRTHHASTSEREHPPATPAKKGCFPSEHNAPKTSPVPGEFVGSEGWRDLSRRLLRCRQYRNRGQSCGL